MEITTKWVKCVQKQHIYKNVHTLRSIKNAVNQKKALSGLKKP